MAFFVQANPEVEARLTDPEAAEESGPELLLEDNHGLRGRWLTLTWRGGLAGCLVLAGAAITWASMPRTEGLVQAAAVDAQEKYGSRTPFDQWLNSGRWEVTTAAPATEPIPGAPGLDLHDRNPCYNDEELSNGLCYKKCALLTADEYPHRGSAFTCCRSNPCTFSNTKLVARLCSGFDVSGDRAGQGACPHAPGACLVNEELFLGVCYKKCSLMTNGEYPHRTSSATCCKSESTFECFKFSNVKGSLAFAASGGQGDHDRRTPRVAHPPIPALAEGR